MTDKTEVQETKYRGYVLTHNEVACDIWKGDEWVCQEPNLDKAKAVIDEWHNAP